MAKPSSRPVPSIEQIPDWVLAFPDAGLSPTDAAANARKLAEFHRWQRDKRAWLTAHGATFRAVELQSERRRRAATQPLQEGERR